MRLDCAVLVLHILQKSLMNTQPTDTAQQEPVHEGRWAVQMEVYLFIHFLWYCFFFLDYVI